MKEKYVITIGRQFGSGGREIGRLIAEKLGIEYYDKELLAEAAKEAGVNTEFFEESDERSPNFFAKSNLWAFNVGYSIGNFFSADISFSDDKLYQAQSEVIKKFADKSPCVIVGRSADYVLREHTCLISIFISASEEACIKRIIKRCDCKNAEEAIELIEKKNKLRSNYYNFYTDKEWGYSASYDLCIDSSKLSSEQVPDIIIEYVKKRIS
jgi:cytidylate kinase